MHHASPSGRRASARTAPLRPFPLRPFAFPSVPLRSIPVRKARLPLAIAAVFLTPAAFAQAPADALAPVEVRGQRPAEVFGLDTPSSTGSRLGLTPRQTPGSLTIVDRDALDARGVRDTQEALRLVPGLNASAPPGSAGSVFFRGFQSTQITQLFNGISVQYDAIAARPVDAWIYDRVEVLGGPGTFLFGAGAVGGAINYVTKLATRDADFSQAQAGVGSFGTGTLSAGLNRRFGEPGGVRHALRADVSRTHSDGFVDGQRRDAWTVAVSWLADLSPTLSHTLALEWQDERVQRPYWGTPVRNPAVGSLQIDPRTRFLNFNAADGFYGQSVTWVRSITEWRPAPGWSLRNTLYHYDALRDYRNVEVYRFDAANAQVIRSATLLQRHDQQLTGNRLEALHDTMIAGLPSAFAVGVDYSVNQQTRFPRSLPGTVNTVDPFAFVPEPFFSIPGMVPGFLPDRSNDLRTLAVFAENRTRLTPTLALLTSLRHDRIDLTVRNLRAVTATDPAVFSPNYAPTTGRVGLTWDVSPGTTLYAQYATAADPPAGILTTANFAQLRTFGLTTGRQVEAGAKFESADGRAVTTLAVYDIVRRNLATADASNPGTTVPVGQQSSRGVEWAGLLQLTRATRVAGNLAWVDAQFDQFVENVGGVGVSRAGNTPTNVPSWVANAWIDHAIDARWRVGADLRYVGPVFANNANTQQAAGYVLAGAYATLRLNRQVQITARVRNLTDRTYALNVTGTPMLFLGAPRSYELLAQFAF